jgi:phage shock protein E
MSKKSRSKNSRRSKSGNIAIRKSYVYAGIAALAIIIVAAVALLSSAPTATGVAEALSPAQYQEQFGSSATDHLLLDVRTPEEFAAGHIEGAANLNVDTLAQNLDQVPTDKPVVLYCRTGRRSKIAQDILVKAGYTVVYDLGGIVDWQAQGFSLTQ